LGINVLEFNFQGTWSSEGEFSFESSMEDIGASISFLKKEENIERFNIDTSNIIVAGYSYGGAMAITEAIYNPEIKRIISIAGADESVFGRKMLTDQNFRTMLEQMLKESEFPEGPVKCDTESYVKDWLSNLDKYDQVKHAKALLDRDILFIGGWKDYNVVLEEHILPLYRKLQELNSNKIQIHVFDTDHGFGGVREELAVSIEKWIKEMK
jgi:dipeptidyl aminopeptidase/acylaminoacyl peptidase